MAKDYKAALALARALGLKDIMKTLQQSPLDPAFVQNPYRVYSEILADKEPVRYWQDYGKTAFFGADAIRLALRDRRLGREPPEGQRPNSAPHLAAFRALEDVSMLELEPPAHTRLRGLVLRAFTSRKIRSLVPDINAVCADLLAALPGGPFDLLQAFCAPLPVRIIARLLGVPESMAPQLLAWSNAMVAMYQAGRTETTEHEANAAALAFTAFLSDHIAARRDDPADDLITELIRAESDGQKLTRMEMIGTCVLLLNAGHEATVHMLGNGVKTLLEHETPLSALAAEHIETTVEELLRYDPPLHIFNRFACDDMDLMGHHIRRGEEIMLVLGAAGRDPRTVAQPDRFDPFRDAAPHAAFGGGLHFCVGAPLARLELQIGLRRLFEARPNLRIVQPPLYANSYHFHGLQKLMVEG